jgi:hypothetical protein
VALLQEVTDGLPRASFHDQAELLAEALYDSTTVLIEATGGGLWRFDFGTAGSGTVTVLSGEPVQATPKAIVFRLKGRPGEHISFVLRLPPGT